MLQRCLSVPASVRFLFIGKWGRLSAWDIFIGAFGWGGVDGPMIHRLWTWTLLILNPEMVEGRYLVSVSVGTTSERCANPLGAASPPPWRRMNHLRSGTLRIALEWRLWQLIGQTTGPIDPCDPRFIHSIKPMFLDQSCSSKLCPRERTWVGLEACHGVGAAAPGRAGRTCRAGRAWWCGRA
jgi:hypothetical protein